VTAWGMLPLLAVMLPVLGMVLAPALGARVAERVVLALLPVGLTLAVGTAVAVLAAGMPLVHHLGRWTPPLGLAVGADGIAAVMLLTSAIVVAGVAIFARTGFRLALGAGKAEPPSPSGRCCSPSGAG
jgi:multicomponent Na+:H+ antiporter subunit D